eukprot:11187830-Lingulodinium_polyedra.AAC.1
MFVAGVRRGVVVVDSGVRPLRQGLGLPQPRRRPLRHAVCPRARGRAEARVPFRRGRGGRRLA